MTTTEEVKQHTPLFYMNDIFPVYSTHGMDDDAVDSMISDIHEMGFQTFYLLAEEIASEKVTEKITSNYTTTKTVSRRTPKLLKCTKNIVGNSVSEVSANSFSGLGGVKPQAFYNLPKMTSEFIERLDDFFRFVHKQHGTEAIIIFTYDSTYLETDNPADGWGIAVPKQENTAASCDYDQQSILDILPDEYDHIFQVGTAHSHPMMDAYCSGTDKADQASFDGVHITFGWKGPVTEHHIELQMGDHAYTLRPDQVFDFEVTEVDDKVKSWSKQVTKKKAIATYGSYGGWEGSGSTSSSFKTLTQETADKLASDHLPDGVPSPIKATVIYSPITHRLSLKECPVCTNEHFNVNTARCYKCMSYLLDPSESLEDLIELRRKNFKGAKLDVDPATKPDRSIWLVEEDYDEEMKPIFRYQQIYKTKNDKIEAPEQKIVPRSGGSDVGLFEDEYNLNDDSPLFDYVVCTECGGKNEMNAWECTESGCTSYTFVPPGTTVTPKKKGNQDTGF